jgi:hypothetical protein
MAGYLTMGWQADPKMNCSNLYLIDPKIEFKNQYIS